MKIINYEILENISRRVGDSFYIFNSEKVVDNYKELISSFQKEYRDTIIAYSYKTNYLPVLCKILNECGGNAEIVSEMELFLAIKLGIDPCKIYYNGPYKKEKYVEELLLMGGNVNLDGEYELEMISEIAKRHSDKEFGIGIRISLDIEQEVPSRFGFDYNNGDLERAIEYINNIGNVRVKGLHCHLPYRSLDSYKERIEALKIVLSGMGNYCLDYISLGGGYMGKIDPKLSLSFKGEMPSYSDYAKIVASGFASIVSKWDKKPSLIIEPGTAIVADSMNLITKVINIKSVRNKDIATLSGSTYNMNPSVKGLNRPIDIYTNNKCGQRYDNLDMAGYTCIEGDYLYKGYSGVLSKGDFVVFRNVGSYSIVMKPPFILPDIAIVELKGDEYKIVKKAQNIERVFEGYELFD